MNTESGSSAVITNSFGDQYFHDVNGSAFNNIGSEALYKKHFAEKLLQENTLYILWGTDSGLLPKYLQGVGLPKGTRYIFVELPDIAARLAKVTPKDDFDSKIILTTPEEWVQRAAEIDYQNYFYLGNMQFHRSIGAEDLNVEGYQDGGRLLQEELEQIRWKLTVEMGNEVFNLRQLENLSENRQSAACLEKSFLGKTAVILGGGPSLDESLPWVIENRGSMVVIAVSRIARRLLEVGLAPDIIVSIDPHEASYDISKEMLLLWEHAIFVHQYHVSSKLLGQWCGRNLYIGPRFGWPTHLNDGKFDARGPTVTNCSIDLAVHMGFSRLLLTGVDLCFGKDGITHAKGSNEHQAGPQLGKGQLWVKTNNGLAAETTPDLNCAIASISNQARIAKEKDCQIYNLGKSAAQVEGVIFCEPGKVLLESLPQPASEKLREILPAENSEDRIDILNDMLAELNRAIMIFKEIKFLSEEALKANDSFFGRRGKGKGSPKYRNKMDKIEKKLKNKFPDFSRLIKKIGIRSFLRLTHGDLGQEWDDYDVDRLGRIYYESYRDSTKRLLDMSQMAKERLLSRIEEEKVSPDFELLIGQWEKDKQPGRVLVWKSRHENNNIPEKFLTRINVLEAEFGEILHNTETLHMAKVSALSRLGPVCGKLKLMFRRGEEDNLQHLLNSLQTLDNQEAKSLFHLGGGFLNELTGNVENALSEYLLVIDLLIEEQKGAVLEEALLRVLSISLERIDAENALLAASCLAGFSPAYLPYYAETLRLSGDKVGALDTYADYLEVVSTDISVMIKMGRLYMDLGIVDGAKLMFGSVLDHDPCNQAALHFMSNLDARLEE